MNFMRFHEVPAECVNSASTSANPVTAEDVRRILLEVILRRPPATPDSPSQMRMRFRLRSQVKAIVRRGWVVDIPEL